MRDAFLGYFYL